MCITMGTAEAIAMMMIVTANSFAIAVSPDQLAFMPKRSLAAYTSCTALAAAARLDSFYLAL